jgi:hypothetical protein
MDLEAKGGEFKKLKKPLPELLPDGSVPGIHFIYVPFATPHQGLKNRLNLPEFDGFCGS